MPRSLAVDEALGLTVRTQGDAPVLDGGEAPERGRDTARQLFPGRPVHVERRRIGGQRERLGLAEVRRAGLIRLVLEGGALAGERLDRALVGIVRCQPDLPADGVVL